MIWETTKLGEVPKVRTKVFISPVNLTANGPAHLGHAGGPFLRMDVLARHLRRIGHDVKTALTTDQFENHIEVQASKLQRVRSEFASENDDLIRTGLEALGIVYDVFPNTGLRSVAKHFSEVADGLTQALGESGGINIT